MVSAKSQAVTGHVRGRGRHIWLSGSGMTEVRRGAFDEPMQAINKTTRDV